MKTLSLVIPVYYNEQSLPPLFVKLQEIERALAENSMALELIFVDDGSGDGSLQELFKIKQQRPATRIIKLSRNFGANRASKCGMQHATGDCCMVLAADLQDPPSLILQMVEKWKAGSKFTICTRISRNDPLVSRIYSRVFYWLLNRLVMKDYPQGGFDVALMDKSMLPPIQKSAKNLHTPLLAYWLGYRPEVIPYHRAKREHGRSRWTFKKKFNAFLDIILGFSVTPIRMISLIGGIVSFCSFIYGLRIACDALFGKIPVQGFASLAVLITFLLGLIIIMLGVIGEYLWRVFDETNKRPEVVIDEVY